MTSSDLDRLLDSPRIELGQWPTPISLLPRPGTPGILIKRDDLSGHGRGGVKTRKIEHLVGYMLARGYHDFITVVGNVSNLVRDILPVLQDFGLQSTIFIADDPPMPARAREEVFADLHQNVHLLGPGRFHAVRSIVVASLKSHKRNGCPFVVLPGLMHPAGVVGNARGFIEMVSQVRTQGIPLPHTVFITVSSGTTFAGFLVAENALRRDDCPPIRIVGVQVYPGQARWRILGLIRWTERFFALHGRVPLGRIELVSNSLYGGFGSYSEEIVRLCLRLQRDSGIEIDPIFGGKTWSVMESYPAHGIDDRPVLYWHCGYTPDWQVLGRIVRI